MPQAGSGPVNGYSDPVPGGKGLLARKADNLAAICCGSLDGSEPYGRSRLVRGIALPVFTEQRSTSWSDDWSQTLPNEVAIRGTGDPRPLRRVMPFKWALVIPK
jgi:hypothetical protein